MDASDNNSAKNLGQQLQAQRKKLERSLGILVLLFLVIFGIPMFFQPKGEWTALDRATFQRAQEEIQSDLSIALEPIEIRHPESLPAAQNGVSIRQPAELREAADEENEAAGGTGSSPARQVLSGWSLRLGIYQNRKNAKSVEARLIAQGFQPYLRELPAPRTNKNAENSEIVIGIYLGPWLTREQAFEAQGAVRQKLDWHDFLLVRYQVPSVR